MDRKKKQNEPERQEMKRKRENERERESTCPIDWNVRALIEKCTHYDPCPLSLPKALAGSRGSSRTKGRRNIKSRKRSYLQNYSIVLQKNRSSSRF
jgi:hypothetical protein